MSQAVFSRDYGIPLKTLQHWEHAGTTQTARLPPTFGRLRSFPIKSAKRSSVTRCSSRPRSSTPGAIRENAIGRNPRAWWRRPARRRSGTGVYKRKAVKVEGHRLVRRSEDEKEYMVKSGNST